MLPHADIITHMAKYGFESVALLTPGGIEKSDIVRNPITCPEKEGFILPQTVTYTVTVPEPMETEPTKGTKYWGIDTISDPPVVHFTWLSSAQNKFHFQTGNYWDSQEKAQAAFDALFSPLRTRSC
jgi:hypothetical protein